MRTRLWLSVPAGALVLLAFELPDVGVGSAVAALLVAGVLALAITRSTASGPALVVVLAGLVFVTSWLVNIPEGVLFDVIEPAAAPVGLVKALAATMAAVVVQVAVAGRVSGEATAMTSDGPIRSVGGLLWRLVASPAVFIVFYFVAGMIIYPFVQQYYVGRTMPDPAAIVSMQVLRSLALAGAAYPLLRTFRHRGDALLVLTLAIPVFGALAPLLPANDVMPAQVRLVHALETVPYYALFGALVAVWFGPPRRRATAVTETSVTEPVPAEHTALA